MEAMVKRVSPTVRKGASSAPFRRAALCPRDGSSSWRGWMNHGVSGAGARRSAEESFWSWGEM